MNYAILGLTLGLLLAVSGTAGALGEEAKVTCAPAPVAPPPDLAAWSQQADVAAAAKAGEIASAQLTPGKAVKASLQHTPDVAYVVAPKKPGGSASYGGMLNLVIAEAGTYRVAIGNGSWIDVLDGQHMLKTAGHSPGPACTGIHKMVDFELAKAAYVLQLSAGPDPSIGVLVTRLP